MFDIKNRRHFLKRVKNDDIRPDMLFIGAVLNVYSRQLKIIDYCDEYTRGKVDSRSERTLAMVKPDAIKHLGKILHAIYQSGFIISNMKMCKLSKREAEEFYAVHRGKPFYDTLTDFMSSGRIVAMELVASGAIKKWRDLLGPTDSDQARIEAPDSIRAHFGTNKTYNACHGSDAPETAAEELAFFFRNKFVGKCDVGRGTTLAVIKPHVVKDGSAGLIIDLIQENFALTALQNFTLDKIAAAEFYEVYKGVLAPGEFNGMVDELAAGGCIALEVADRDGADPVEPFRELCGPMDPELGRVLRPKSLRAMFGLDKARNAVHCTDLPEDGELEVNYFFTILAST